VLLVNRIPQKSRCKYQQKCGLGDSLLFPLCPFLSLTFFLALTLSVNGSSKYALHVEISTPPTVATHPLERCLELLKERTTPAESWIPSESLSVVACTFAASWRLAGAQASPADVAPASHLEFHTEHSSSDLERRSENLKPPPVSAHQTFAIESTRWPASGTQSFLLEGQV
jgi:hypothetical protein